MKRTILLLTAALGAAIAAAQQPAPAPTAAQPRPTDRVRRTETVPYDTRHDAEARDRAASGHTIDFRPEVRVATEGPLYAVLGQQIEIPYVWTDGCVYLRIENPQSAYQLWVNDRRVADVDDALTPAEFDLTEYVRQGKNDFKLLMFDDRGGLDARNPVARAAFEGSCLYYQEKRSIADFEIALAPDSAGRDFGVLRLDLLVRNGYNYDEPVTVGYDIYSPQGKLLDFDMREVVVAGRSVDTVRFRPYIYHTFDNKWEAGAKSAPLYKVMLFTRRDGAYREYMPLRIGFGRTELIDGKLMRFGRELRLEKAVCNAAADRKTTLGRLRALKSQGKNTVCPDYPQPDWFYDLCDELGLYVIDRANIHAPERRTDRSVGGTPANDPALADEFLERVKAMYYRSHNHTCVIAFALGGPSGNGYNMYKAYEWLKSVEKHRPVLYEDADGEWNTDL